MAVSRKIFVVDTSVLLYDKTSLTSFTGNDVVIPLLVLDELDRFKEKPGILGESARYVNRFLDELREEGSLSEGVYLSDVDENIRVEISASATIPPGLDASSDNRIIAVALDIQTRYTDRNVIMVTKDINFRVKCDALGLQAEDYYKDNVRSELPDEIQEIWADDSYIDRLHSDKSIESRNVDFEYDPRIQEPLIIRGSSPSSSALGVYKGETIFHVSSNPKMNDLVKIKPKNKEQAFALHFLLDRSVPLVTMTGIAGTGKTFLTLMAGLSGIYEKVYKRIVISRPIQPVGRDMGFLPGDVDDKMAVWIKPITDNFREGSGQDATYFDMMRENGTIEVAPLAFIRGRTLNDSFIIVDEAQNASIHELKTLITRVGQNSKIILLGDIDQIDTPHLDRSSNGLSITIDRFKDMHIAAHINLTKSERSELAAIASKIL